MKPLRVILNYKDQRYKLLNFFVDKKDNSFYFHIYRKPNETPMAPDGKSHEPIQEINFKKFTSTGFPENKISFHETGIVHSTDKDGRRDRDGICGVAFDKIKNFQVVLAVAPPDPVQLIKLSKQDSRRDIILNLSNLIEPFSVQFFIYKKNSAKKPHIPKSLNIFNGLVHCEFGDKNHGLMLAGIKVAKSKKGQKIEWPPFTLVLKILGQK